MKLANLVQSAVIVCLAYAGLPAAACADESAGFHGKLSALESFRDVLGDGWHGPSGIVVDDVNNLDALDEPTRKTAEALVGQFAPMGIVAFADFSYTRKDFPRIVTVRLFVFKDLPTAEAWWKTKYEHDGWEQYYEKVADVGDAAVVSTETTKIAARQGNVWLTSHQLHKGDEFKRALKHYVKRVAPGPATDETARCKD
jgi:hypothetical protein